MTRNLRTWTTVVAVAVSIAVAGLGQTAGFIHGEIFLDLGDPWPAAMDLDFEVGLETTVGGWSIGSLVDLEQDGLEDLAFVALGSVGAVSVYSLYWLEGWTGGTPIPGVDLDQDWDNALWTSISGVDLWAFFSIRETTWEDLSINGAGLAVGAHGAAGGVEVWAEAQFNLESMLPYVYWNGFARTIEKNLACDLISVLEPTCSLDVSFIEFYLDFTACCAEIGSWLGFDPDGFYGLEFWVLDVATGLPGLTLAWIDLYFELDDKDLDFAFEFDPGFGGCIRPFVSLLDKSSTVSGLRVAALDWVCEIGNATVTISELLSDHEFYIGIDGAIHGFPRPFSFWAISEDCVEPVFDANEAVSVEVGDAGCCGGDDSIHIVAFFDTALDDVLFDWLGARARADIALTSNLSAYVEIWMWYDEVETIAMGLDITWGTLRAVTADWTCCLAPI